MTKEFGKKINELIKTITENLSKWDEIYFQKIVEYKASIFTLQTTNAESIRLLSDKVFSISFSLLEFKSLVS